MVRCRLSCRNLTNLTPLGQSRWLNILVKNVNKLERLDYRSLWGVDMECDAKSPNKMQKVKRNIDSGILDRFWDLVDASDDRRLIAAEQLLTALSLKQPPVNERCYTHG